MDPNFPPQIALCPHCLKPVDLTHCYRLNVSLTRHPLSPIFPAPHVPENLQSIPPVLTNQLITPQLVAPQVFTSQQPAPEVPAIPAIQQPATEGIPQASQQSASVSTPKPSRQAASKMTSPSSQPTGPSVCLTSSTKPSGRTHPPALQDNQRDGGKRRQTSTSSFDSMFSEIEIDTAFVDEFQAIQDSYFSQRPFEPSSQPPSLPPSSPIAETPETLSAMLISSPPAESSMTLPETGELPASERRWVVFSGHVPGIYMSSADAHSQTTTFANSFILAFDEPLAADRAYERFQEDGTIPAESCGPWVVFIGRNQGVFTMYEELCTSVVGFPGNRYRICDSIEEAHEALEAFQARPPPISPPTDPAPGTITSSDKIWWCCFAGAEPGVYEGLDRLLNAYPIPGGVHKVDSEEAGWYVWIGRLVSGEVRMITRK